MDSPSTSLTTRQILRYLGIAVSVVAILILAWFLYWRFAPPAGKTFDVRTTDVGSTWMSSDYGDDILVDWIEIPGTVAGG